MKYEDYWFPVRWGLSLRKKLVKFSSSYGTTKTRRALSVFFATLLDENHQETFKGTINERYRNG